MFSHNAVGWKKGNGLLKEVAANVRELVQGIAYVLERKIVNQMRLQRCSGGVKYSVGRKYCDRVSKILGEKQDRRWCLPHSDA